MKKHQPQKLISRAALMVLFAVLLLSSCKISKPAINETRSEISRSEAEAHDWENALKYAFRQHYKDVKNNHAKRMHAAYPVITQDLLNMTLIRSNGDRVRFKMDKKAYFTFAHTSHTPLAIYSILYPVNFNVDNDSTLLTLNNYKSLVANAIEGIKKVNHINEGQKDRILSLLKTSNQYLQKIISDKKTSKEEFHAFTKSVRKHIEANLYDGAMEQLTQFHEKLHHWKSAYPNENWDELRVVVMGFHQPRDLYALKLFFQWLLDEPETERRVVYAEFQFSMFGKNRGKAEDLALKLLATVDLDKEASLFLLGEKTLLQKDVMGPATVKILESWGPTKWFSGED